MHASVIILKKVMKKEILQVCACDFSIAVVNYSKKSNERKGLFGLMVAEGASPSWWGWSRNGVRSRKLGLTYWTVIPERTNWEWCEALKPKGHTSSRMAISPKPPQTVPPVRTKQSNTKDHTGHFSLKQPHHTFLLKEDVISPKISETASWRVMNWIESLKVWNCSLYINSFSSSSAWVKYSAMKASQHMW